MDNLVLIRTAETLHESLRRTVLLDLRQEGPFWFRARFEGDDGPRSLLISMRPESPWIARPVRLPSAPARHRTPFLDLLRKRLLGRVLVTLEKPGFDRWVELRFQDGVSLVVELSPHGGNLTLLDSDRRVLGSLRTPRRRIDALQVGSPWIPPRLPSGPLDPSTTDPGTMDEQLAEALSAGQTLADAIRSQLFGLGTAAPEMLAAEAREAGQSGALGMGRRICERLEELTDGRLDPVVVTQEDGQQRLLPWAMAGEQGDRSESDPAATAGRYYMEREWDRMQLQRRDGLIAILERELDRLRKAADRVQGDLDRLGDPGLHRRQAEALAAGLTRLERDGDRWTVPNPISPSDRIVISHRAGANPRETIDELYGRVRRAQRGRQQIEQRLQTLQSRRDRLRRVQADEALDTDELEQELRAAGIPVGIRADTRAERASAQIRRPRIEGLRMLVSRAGETILVGRNARENHHVTFRLAGPEDFWFHALGVSGAHVIVRNEQRLKRPRKETLEDAAAAAAYYSDARMQTWVDVQWTRRKWVRKPRGAAPGAVLVKRSETIRVQPTVDGLA